MKLYGSPLAQAALRVQLAAAIKKIPLDVIELDVVSGEHLGAVYSALNPMNTIPALMDGPEVIGQSTAILEYLEEVYPEPSLLPQGRIARADCRALTHYICSDITPLGSLRVVKHLGGAHGFDADAQRAWRQHWYDEGFSRLETMIAEIRPADAPFIFGDAPTMVECVLAGALFGARRFGLTIDRYTVLQGLDDALFALDGLAHLRRPAA